MDRSEEMHASDRFRQTYIWMADSDTFVGKGSFARVEKVIWHSTPCAAKFFHKILRDADAKPSAEGNERGSVNKPFDDFIREAEEWSRLLIHPNIVQYLDLWRDPDGDDPKNVAIIMELLPTSLHDFLESNVESRRCFPLQLKNSLLIDVSRAMVYLHAQGIYHRDLTPKNVLLDRSLRAKVADFGVAKMCNSTKRLPLTVQPGTRDFMPPEALTKPPMYDKTLDSFSFGCLMLFTFTHEWPHPTDAIIEEGNMEELSEEQRRKAHIDHLLPGEQAFYPLIQECLSTPNKRPSFEKILGRLQELPYIDDDLEYLAAVRSQLFNSNHEPKQDLEHDRSHEQVSILYALLHLAYGLCTCVVPYNYLTCIIYITTQFTLNIAIILYILMLKCMLSVQSVGVFHT